MISLESAPNAQGFTRQQIFIHVNTFYRVFKRLFPQTDLTRFG